MCGDDSNGSEVKCQVCQDPKSVKPNEIVICDRCELGFHQLCHSPKIPSSVLIPDVSWVCKSCFYSMSSEERTEFKITINAPQDNSKASSFNNLDLTNDASSSKIYTKLPYDLSKLHWDDKHLTNREDVYCYCSKGLDFFRSLLQCFTCKQWFHIICIRSIEMDLLIGDQYFKFVCSVCNKGSEVCQRIIMKWKVAVGLTLSNLTYGSDSRYFSIDDDIIPYLIENEDKFKLSVKLENLSKEELVKKISTNLKENADKFLCKDGRWCLNVEFPYNDPLTYSPFREDLQSTFAIQKESANKWKSLADSSKISATPTTKVPDGACRKNASAQPIKFIQFKKLNDSKAKRRHSTDNSNLSDSLKSKKSRRHSNSLLKVKDDTNSNSSTVSDPQHDYREYKDYMDEKNLNYLDQAIPFPSDFEGKNNPFYYSPVKKESRSPSSDSKTTTTNSGSSATNNHHHHHHHHQKRNSSSSSDKVEYRVVNNEPNKLVLSRVNSINENSTPSFNSHSPLNGSSLINNSSINASLLSTNGSSKNVSSTAKLTNGHAVQKSDELKDDKKIKIIGHRMTPKGLIEYMLECTDKEQSEKSHTRFSNLQFIFKVNFQMFKIVSINLHLINHLNVISKEK